jgi:4-hydroxy-tetrahydrodipicolinate synthase
MAIKLRGVMQSPVTPLQEDFSPDLPTFEKLLDFHERTSGTAIDLPLIAYNSPSYLSGIEFTGELVTRLLARLPNFVAMKEASFNSEKFLEIARAALAARPDFSLVTGVEYLLPSVPLGGVGSYSSAGAICPNLCAELFESCVAADWPRARECQYKLSRLWLLFRDQSGEASRKSKVERRKAKSESNSVKPFSGHFFNF